MYTSFVLSHPRPPGENIWWLDLNFLSQCHIRRMHNYCAKNGIGLALYLLLDS